MQGVARLSKLMYYGRPNPTVELTSWQKDRILDLYDAVLKTCKGIENYSDKLYAQKFNTNSAYSFCYGETGFIVSLNGYIYSNMKIYEDIDGKVAQYCVSLNFLFTE